MFPSSAVITGSNRGLGLELVRQLVGKSGISEIIATCRDPSKAHELREMAQKHSNIHVLQLDVREFDKFPEFAKNVDRIVGEKGLTMLFNNAGVTSKFASVDTVSASEMIETFQTNTVAPLLLTKACLPLLKRAALFNKDIPISIARASVINMSSEMGSIQDNVLGGFYPYRTSKAALNAVTKSLSIDLHQDDILAVSLHPGWVKTSMGGNKAPLEPSDSVSAMWNVLSQLTETDNGSFVGFDGSTIPW